ncbi:hypothetical protein [Rhizobium giardinii]|uniref:hypothetical protein n=1 Tax=Rhizobium giardinii TaxID=56731 RepID=UPI001F2213A2|nr:hypothetical protein [Rhizobium giardinii]
MPQRRRGGAEPTDRGKEATSVAAGKGAAARAKRERLPRLTAAEEQALQAYAAKHGRRWKSVLNHVWMGGQPHDDGATLRRQRNARGPTWLQSYRLPKPRPDEEPDSEHRPDVPET